MDWTHECELAKQFAVALAGREGMALNVGAAKAQGGDLAHMGFELARAFNIVEAERTAAFSAEKTPKKPK